MKPEHLNRKTPEPPVAELLRITGKHPKDMAVSLGIHVETVLRWVRGTHEPLPAFSRIIARQLQDARKHELDRLTELRENG